MVAPVSLMALSQVQHLNTELARDSLGLILSYSMFDDISRFAPNLGVVQDKILSRIVRSQTSLLVSVAILTWWKNLPLMTFFDFGPLTK